MSSALTYFGNLSKAFYSYRPAVVFPRPSEPASRRLGQASVLQRFTLTEGMSRPKSEGDT
jgi:hypothetical protein